MACLGEKGSDINGGYFDVEIAPPDDFGQDHIRFEFQDG